MVGLCPKGAAFTDLRTGECAALRVGDLDLLRSRVTVRESVSEVHGRIVFTTTKNHSARSVAIPRFLCERLAAHHRTRPDNFSALHCSVHLIRCRAVSRLL